MTAAHRIIGMGLWVALLSVAAPGAQATHRADFFDVSRKPVVLYDKGKQTWTLRNQAVERVIRFDAKTGSLQTTGLRDIRHNTVYPTLPGSEGALSFAPLLNTVPRLLEGWKLSETPPADNWTQKDFNDSNWKPAALPLQTEAQNKTWWLRCPLPADVLADRHAYVLLLDHIVDDEAEIYLDGMLAQKIRPAEQPWNRAYQIDLTPQNRLVAIKMTRHGRAHGMPGTVGIAQVGSSPPNLDLSSDWQYVLHSVNANEDSSKVLTISLTGTKRYEGFDLDVHYQIYPGDEPYFAKWFSFTSHRSNRFLIDELTYDRRPLPGPEADTQFFPGNGFTVSSRTAGSGMMSGALSPLGATESSEDNKSVAVVLRPGYLIRPDMPLETPKSVLALYHGPTSAGAFLYQLYIGQYIAHATPDSVPPVYNTWYGYHADINAATCEKIIPLAAELGVKVFVVDNGWQTNSRPDTGDYGDWVTDRSANRFPNGLAPISLLVRENKMRFGLWTAPILVNTVSQAAVQHPSWLLKQTGNVTVPFWEGTRGMCFSTGWAENYTEAMRSLCQELSATYLKLDSALFFDSCVNPGHDHSLGHAMPDQIEAWTNFCQSLRKLDPNFVVNRGWDNSADLTALQDEGWFSDWEIGEDAKRQADVRAWYRNADMARGSLYDLTGARPPFTIAGETPCHIPANLTDLNALEYHFTSIGANICNVEIHGKLEEMTGPERDLLKKWIQWNQDNRPWLAYIQPLTALGRPTDWRDPNAKPHIDGVMHLRNALQGRYGYICLWNPGESQDKTSVSINPADYQVRMNLKDVTVTRLKDGSAVPFTSNGSALTLSDLTMAPRSWEIYEIRAKK